MQPYRLINEDPLSSAFIWLASFWLFERFRTGLRARSHGVSPSLLSAQADSLNADIVFYQTTWETYESHFVGNMMPVVDMILAEVVPFLSANYIKWLFHNSFSHYSIYNQLIRNIEASESKVRHSECYLR